MKNFKFSTIEGDEIHDFISAIEKSFAIQFKDNELINTSTIGEFCEIIKLKTNGNTEGCTSQQAFYKLRDVILSVRQFNAEIKPNTSLSDIFPEKDRIKTIKSLEKQSGFKLNILTAKGWIITSLLLLLAVGVITLLFNKWIGTVITITAILSLFIAGKTGKELTIETIGDLTNHIKTYNYSASRRNAETYNHDEIEDIVINILTDITGYSKDELLRMSA